MLLYMCMPLLNGMHRISIVVLTLDELDSLVDIAHLAAATSALTRAEAQVADKLALTKASLRQLRPGSSQKP